jgi:enamine deaminase RidA (YjgF/YER057c/UK114 family)
VPLDANGTLVGAGDFIAQTGQALANLEAMLQDASTHFQYVINTTVYVVATEQRHLSEVWSVVRASRLRAEQHTSTLVGVSMLGYTGQLVEIAAVAVIPPAPHTP